MKPVRTYYIVISAVVLFILSVTFYFIYHSHRDASRLVKQQFFQQQSLLSRQTALGIEQNFRLLEREIELLALDPSVRMRNPGGARKAMERTFSYVKDLYVTDVSLGDEKGVIRITLFSPDLVGRDFSFRTYYRKMLDQKAPDHVYEYITFHGIKKGNKGIIIAMPVFSESGKFAGPLVFVTEVHDLISGYLRSLPQGIRGWAMDSDGVILYHPSLSHGTVIDTAAGLDPSFRLFAQSLKKGAVERGEYRLLPKTGPRMMATAKTITVADKSLSIVLEAAEENVQGYLGDFSTKYIIGTSLALATIFTFMSIIIILIYQGNIKLALEVNERRRAEQRIRENEERFRHLIDYSPLAKAIVSRDEKITYLNRKFTETLGYTLEMIPTVGEWLKLAYPDEEYRRKMENKWKRYVSGTGPAKTEMRPSEYQVTDIHGKVHTMEIYGSYTGDSHLIIFNDISERRALEHQLMHSQKMDCFGQLAGGIAHDFNNILSAIIGYGEILLDSMERDNPQRPSVDVILSAANSAAKLTNSLLAFSRKQVLNPQPLRINELIRNLLRLLVRLIGEDIRIETALHNEDIEVTADYSQMEQVLLNLATNARDAMPGGGTIRIETDATFLDSSFVSKYGYGRPGRYAVVSFADTGAGMDKAVLGQIFEPFFTTKEVGRGTGLGLAIVYGIINQHNGFIEASSSPGKGTVFTIYLPANPAHREEMQPTERDREHEIRGGSECILIAEDDQSVRETITNILGSAGYRVIVATNGDEAVRLFRKEGAAIDMLLFDVIMPTKNGKEAFDEIQRMKPDAKILFLSGYAHDLIQQKGIFREGLHFVSKPVTTKRLLEKIREILDMP